MSDNMTEVFSSHLSGDDMRTPQQVVIDELTKERDELRAVVEKYADRDNWGYYDDSGCSKGHGSSTDACFIGPEVAEATLAATQNGGGK